MSDNKSGNLMKNYKPKGPSLSEDFPILRRLIHGQPLVYLDNAATTQKPQVVIDAIVDYYTTSNANVHRGVHTLSDESTQRYEAARKTVARFFGADPTQLILTRNTTEAMNLLVMGWGEHFVEAGDVIVVAMLDHHSNFVPWQQLAARKQARLEVLPLTPEGEIDLPAARALLREHADQLRVVSLAHVSNALGSVSPVAQIITELQSLKVREQVLVALDCAQSAAHLPLSLQDLEVDALAFSGHKMYGPMGIGGLVLTKRRLDEFQPVHFGGGMIDSVTVESTSFQEDLQERFTAGTPDVASTVALAAACEFIREIGWNSIREHEQELVQVAFSRLQSLPRVRVVGPDPRKSQRIGSVSWTFEGVHAHDVAQLLDRSGVEVRSGHHCTMPLHTYFEWAATTRASFAVYNTLEDVEALVDGLRSVEQVFG